MSRIRELRETKRNLLSNWQIAHPTNIDIYNQIVYPMSNQDYDYFLDFLLLLHQNNGIVDNELVTNYILTDTESRYQLRRTEEVKRAESADGKRECEEIRIQEENRKIQEENRKIQEEERRKKEEERRIQEEERRKKIQEEERILQEEEARRLEQIQDLINTTANVLELPPRILLAQFVDCNQLDLIDNSNYDHYGHYTV